MRKQRHNRARMRKSAAHTALVFVLWLAPWGTGRGVAGPLSQDPAVQVNGSPVLTDVSPAGDPALQVNGSPVVTEASLEAPGLASQLLLPFYLIDATDAFPAGSTTFLSVVNEATLPVDATVRIYASNAPAVPAFVQALAFAPKEARTLDIQQMCPACPVEGFVVIETSLGQPVLHGDYFRADGTDRVGAWRLLPLSGLCKRFTMRFYAEATFIFWTDLNAVTAGLIATVAAYGQAGGDPFLLASIFADAVAFQVSTTDLGLQFSTGHVEVEFAPGIAGHVAVVTTFPSVSSVPMTLDASCTER